MADLPGGSAGPGPSPVRLTHAAATHVGLVRRSNEDSFIAEPGLYAVCDGMGGARAGEVASAVACRKLREVVAGSPDLNGLLRGVRAANREVYRMSLADPALRGMGTTLTAALPLTGRLLVAHVGDSRAYLYRNGTLEQVTEDHSVVGEMVRRGQLTPEQAATHPHRSVITRALGTEEVVEPDLVEVELEPGDRLLLCTDGLSGMVDDQALAGLLGAPEGPDAVAQALVRAALAAGGEDNVTLVVLQADACEEKDAGPLLAVSEERAAAPAPASDGDDTLETRDPAASAVPKVMTVAAPGGRRPVRRRALLGAGAGLIVLLLAATVFFFFNSSVYWVGTAQGQVSLYRGLPYTVLGFDLYDLTEVGPAAYGTLDGYVKARVDQRELLTKEEGQRLVRSLGQAAADSSSSTTTGSSSTTTSLSRGASPPGTAPSGTTSQP